MKPPYVRRSLIVYSDDQALPTGLDIFTAAHLSKSKVRMQNRVLYLVTRIPVPGQILKTWRPTVSLNNLPKSDLDSDSESEDYRGIDETFSFIPSIKLPPSSRRPIVRNKVHDDVISISDDDDKPVSMIRSDDDWDKPGPVVSPPTPPAEVEAIKDTFNSSMNFGDEGNPWIS